MQNIVTDYYNDNFQKEWERLTLPLGAIEFASTLRLIEHYFPPSGSVADVGSGPGSFPLGAYSRRKASHMPALTWLGRTPESS